MTRSSVRTLAIILALLGGCDGEDGSSLRRRANADDDPADGGGTSDPTGENGVPKCSGEVGAAYTGFGGMKLHEGRVDAIAGADRLRVKPYSALRGEYERTIGAVPASLTGADTSFGEPPPRFSAEPKASAIQLYTAFRVAFDGCLTFTSKDAAFGPTPKPETASAQCSALARKFWSRTPSEEEVKQCTEVALVDTASEPDPRKRWAYVCATLLGSAGFLTY